MLIAVTGAGGSIGRVVVSKLLENQDNVCRLLMKDSSKNRKLFRKLQRSFGSRVQLTSGDVQQKEVCLELVKGADAVLHLAAVIPPKADHDEKLTWKVNYQGTCNIADAILETGNTAKLIFFSSVAVYGHRTEQHLWGRVGDPLLPSVFDSYGASKVKAERYILESDLQKWVILRETGVLYDNMMMNNIHDGLIFQTPPNVLIEWVTAHDTAVLIDGILNSADDVKSFWNNVYNIGGGPACRQTGFDTYKDGFKLIGGDAKKIFEPKWHNLRNFHCFWFSDSEILENMFHFQKESCDDFWKWFAKKHRIYRLGSLLPAGLIKSLILKPLLKNSNAPAFWVASGNEAKIAATYGSMEKYNQIPDSWEDVDLICERKDFEEKKKYAPEYDLSHGYDENKPESELTIRDLREAAAFRGGRLISLDIKPGDLRTKLTWQCHNRHVFRSSPYTVLKAGHWCPYCCSPETEWNFDALSKKIPFFAQVWYDSHEKEEDRVYYFNKEMKPCVRKIKE